MRNVGIVRRLDALGRIVIPREYRKMHRIELGDPLEILAMDNGEIVLRKVDLTAELANFGQTVAEAAVKQTGKTVLVSSLRQWVAGSGSGKNGFVGNELPQPIAKAANLRKEIAASCADLGLSIEGSYAAVCPILGDMDCFGVLCLISQSPVSDDELKLMRALGYVTGTNLQKY